MNAENIHQGIEENRPENLDEHVLVGWALVAEWIGPDGTRTLTRMSGTPGGSPPPEWQSKGYLHEALFGRWNS